MKALAFAGARYFPTDEDRLWLLRAVQAECAVATQVAQTLVNGACLRMSRGRCATIAQHVRAYAQPVNPRWFPDGDLFAHWHAIAPAEHTIEKAIHRRDVTSTRQLFDLSAKTAVDTALTRGLTSVPCECTDYAAANKPGPEGWTPLTQPRAHVNRLWTRAPSWLGYSVVDAPSVGP